MFYRWIFLFFLAYLLPTIVNASFIEVTLGTAVVNDATATYHNPAALTLLKNPQLIGLGSTAYYHSQFSGTTIQTATGFTQTGSASSNTRYNLPAFYMGWPLNERLNLGIAIISNFYNSNVDDNSLLRYAQPSNNTNNVDIVPAIGLKVTDRFSIGMGFTYSYVDLLLTRTSGFPTLDVPDSQSKNDANGYGVGGDIGLLFKPSHTTLIGLNYQSSVRYNLSGTSTLQSTPPLTSKHYHLTLWTPARYVFSISHFVSPSLGFIGTIQRIQWSILQNTHIYNIAAQVGPTTAIVNATIPYYLHNAWALTLGSQYKLTPDWVIRAAGSFVQSPGNGSYQLANGNSLVLGVSTGYNLNKHITIDGSYSYVFIQNAGIHITAGPTLVNGTNSGYRDAVSLKVTWNL